MKNSVGFQFLVIVFVCIQNLYAQNNFININNHLDKIMLHAQVLKDAVMTEMNKQGIQPGPGAPPPGNVAYASFVDEVAERLRLLEDSISGLSGIMNRCPNQPSGKCLSHNCLVAGVFFCFRYKLVWFFLIKDMIIHMKKTLCRGKHFYVLDFINLT